MAHFKAGAIKLGTNITCHVESCTFIKNSASVAGAIEIMDGSKMNIEHTLFKSNHADRIDGAFFGHRNVIVHVKNTLFRSNIVDGGGIMSLQTNSTLKFYNSNFTRNTIHAGFGALLLSNNIISDINNCIFSENRGLIGAAIYAESNVQLQIVECIFSRNSASLPGGVISITCGIEAVINSTNFISNTASQGGAIMAQDKTETFVHNSTFFYNTASLDGGAVFGLHTATLILSESYFDHNSATVHGGALTFYDGTRSDISHCEFTNNTAITGGAIASSQNTVTDIQWSLFKNHTGRNGAVIAIDKNASVRVENSTFIHNKADEAGSVILTNDNATGMFLDTYFGDNIANNVGGVIITSNNTVCELTMCHLKNNHAYQGGGINAQVNVDIQINKSNFEENHAESAGALFAHNKVNLVIIETSFLRNSANNENALTTESEFRRSTVNSGGALGISNDANAQILKSEFIGNYALFEGGAIRLDTNVTCSIFSSNFVNNTAEVGAGVSIFYQVRLNIMNSHFRTNNAQENGGVLNVVSGHVEAFKSSFTSNSANRGGAVEVTQSTFKFISSNFTNNLAYQIGGAMHIAGHVVGNVSLCNFANNNALQAGALYMWYNVTIRFEDSHFHQNLATDCVGCLNRFYIDAKSGGCLYIDHTVAASVYNSTFTENFAHKGSVAYIKEQSLIIFFNSVFQSNRALEDGMISLSRQVSATISNCNFLLNTNVILKLLDGAMANITNSNFQGNNDENLGGVILGLNKAVVEIRSSIFYDNRASEGAVLNIQRSKLTVIYSNFTGNVAEYVGGAIVLLHGTEASISHSVFVGNKALNGGAIFATRDCVLNLEHCNLTQNHAHYTGGALVFVKGRYEYESNFPGNDNYPRAKIGTTLTIINSTFTTNTAFLAGAVYLLHVSETTILNSTFTKNSAQKTAAIALTECATTYMENVNFLGNTETGNGIQKFWLYITSFEIMDKVSNVENFKTGGVLTGKRESLLVFKNCSFLQNQAIYAGVAFFTDNVHVIFDGSNFIENNGKYVGVFEGMNSVQVENLNSYFRGNAGHVADIGLLIKNSHMNVSNITLDGITSTTNALRLGSRRSSSLVVSDSVIKNNTLNSHNHCLFQISQSSALMLYNINLENNNLFCAALIFQESVMIINNSVAIGNTFRNSLVTVSDYSILKIYDSVVKQNIIANADKQENSLFIIQENSRLEGNHCEIADNCGRYGAIYCEGQGSMDISDSVFAGNKALLSGGVLFTKNCTTIIQSSNVTGNQARFNGGAIASVDSVLWVCMPYTFTLTFKFEAFIFVPQGI